MITKTLYRTNNNGKVTVSPNKPTEGTYTETYRLIADEGMILTDGENTCTCVDTDYPENYTEISETEDEYSEAGKILMGVSE